MASGLPTTVKAGIHPSRRRMRRENWQRAGYLDDHEVLGQVEGEGPPIHVGCVLLVVVHHVHRLLVVIHLQEGLVGPQRVTDRPALKASLWKTGFSQPGVVAAPRFNTIICFSLNHRLCRFFKSFYSNFVAIFVNFCNIL